MSTTYRCIPHVPEYNVFFWPNAENPSVLGYLDTADG